MFSYPDMVLNHLHWYYAVKIMHIIGVVCWFAGLFYLPRLFVYHAMTTDQSTRDKFKIMEHKLYWYIMCPSAALTIIPGEILTDVFDIHGTWLHMKAALVVVLFVYHLFCFKLMDDFAKDINTYSHKFYRYYNEVPTVILILCVILVVLKVPA